MKPINAETVFGLTVALIVLDRYCGVHIESKKSNFNVTTLRLWTGGKLVVDSGTLEKFGIR